MAGGTSGLFPSLAEQKKRIEEERKAAALAAKDNIARYISMMLSTLIDDGSVVVMV